MMLAAHVNALMLLSRIMQLFAKVVSDRLIPERVTKKFATDITKKRI